MSAVYLRSVRAERPVGNGKKSMQETRGAGTDLCGLGGGWNLGWWILGAGGRLMVQVGKLAHLERNLVLCQTLILGWLGSNASEPPVRKRWGLAPLDPSHLTLILMLDKALA